MKNSINKFLRSEWLWLVLSAVLLISLLPLFVIAVYSRPCIDDFSYSYQLYHYVQNGNWNIFGLLGKAFEVDMQFYETWQGLYSSAFLLALQPGIFADKVYFVGAWVLMILAFVCIFYFINTVFRIIKIEKHYAFIAIFLFVFSFQHLPSINQGLYWYNGSWNYMPFFFLTLVNIALCLKYVFIEAKNRWLVALCVLSFVISGGNHVTGFMNILLLACIAGWTLLKNKHNWKILLPFALAVVGFIIMYVAPGTAVRQAAFVRPGVVKTLFQTFKRSLTFTGEYCGGNCFFYVLALFIFSMFAYRKENFSKSSFKISPVWLVLLGWAIMCGMLCVPYYATGSFGEERLSNVVWLYEIFVIAALVVYSTWYVMFKFVSVQNLSGSAFLRGVLAVSVLVGVFWVNSNYFEISKELANGQASAYAQTFDERIELMKQSNDDIVYVDPLPRSKALWLSDLTSNETDYQNVGWQNYYGVKTLLREE